MTDFGGIGFEAGERLSKNDKSAEAHGSLLLLAGTNDGEGGKAELEKELRDVVVAESDGKISDFESNEFLGLGMSMSSKLIDGL